MVQRLMRAIKNQKTPLHYAAQNGQEAVCRFLVQECQADVNARDIGKRTPLHWAAVEGHEAVCRFLVAQGADVNVRDSVEQTPLHCAAMRRHLRVVCLLATRGGRMHTKLFSLFKPLQQRLIHYMRYKNNPDQCSAIVSGASGEWLIPEWSGSK